MSRNNNSKNRNPDAGVRLQYVDYDVAWICALPSERVAAEVMLDRYHEALPQIDGDENRYILGSVAGHNVVVACLPEGIYGTLSATYVLSDMLRTFRALRWGLMVGIGGGIPGPNNDVRLGDIVVGTKVKPYGPAKVTGEGLQRTAESMVPDNVLLNAVMRLEEGRQQSSGKTPDRIRAILEERLKTMPYLRHPGLPDDLFRADYNHADPRVLDCRRCCNYKSATVQRVPRSSTNPRVHLGVIASGDFLIKSSRAREFLTKQSGAICFEMEAAGLMHMMPCLPIRGISDYSDTHKNKDWQLYAAANAAAYARELLETLPPRRSNPSIGKPQGTKYRVV